MMTENFMDGLGRGLACMALWVLACFIAALLDYDVAAITIFLLPFIFIIGETIWRKWRAKR